jgi:demethylmenaquinone methyltransferase/2-methoxy-6-polyprenyl-1,4-benzoquinol methylase
LTERDNGGARRVLRSKDEARDEYNRASKHYDATEGGFEDKTRSTGLSFLAVEPGERVLEIGFGTGKSLETLARAVGETGRVSGIDLSPGMHAVATKRLQSAGLLDRVDLRTGDATTLPYEDAEFDAVFMSFTLDLIDTPEMPVLLGACWRVLKPGGRLCTVSLSRRNPNSMIVRAYEWFHDRFPKRIDCRPILAVEALGAAGFTIAKVERSSIWGVPVDIVLAIKG